MFRSKKSPRPEGLSQPIQLSGHIADGPHILDATLCEGYLAGQLLVATPLIDAGSFQKSVIYMFAHSDEGAMGLIINQPLETVDMAMLLEGLNVHVTPVHRDLPVYFGGPVERARGFVLHSTDYQKDFTLTTHSDISVTASAAILEDMAHGVGPRHSVMVVGYAGWGPGQLEQEIEQNSWIHVPATPELLFETDDAFKWATASKSLGVDMNFYSTVVGHA